jgi:uncharacterized protein YukE
MLRPDELRRTAARVEHAAGELPSLLDRVARSLGPDVWRGPAADRFAADIDGARLLLGRSADGMRSTAARMRQRAAADEAAAARAAASGAIP